ncbi:MAG TPA: hypothetical protein PKZ97_02920 [Azospirillaceae bacterium]|nr:hypothetical protein [Azospirillaceae bacterium]HRQ80047.1 hypothetical protein [Azospirillaceae bacterium]
MAWSGNEDYSDSAGRLFIDAETLYKQNRWETAGHLYGVAAECAVKATLKRGGLAIDKKSGLKTHFPALAGAVSLIAQGRHSMTVFNRAGFLDSWKVDTRYAKNDGTIEQKLCAAWRQDTADMLLDCGFIV